MHQLKQLLHREVAIHQEVTLLQKHVVIAENHSLETGTIILWESVTVVKVDIIANVQ